MTKDSFNRERFRHAVLVNASWDTVSDALLTASGFEKWFIGNASYTDSNGILCDSDELIHEGDNYKWHWLAKDFSVSGTILKINDDSVSFTFGDSFIVDINFKELDGRILVTLEQKYAEGAMKNDFNYTNCCVCWVFFLTNLKSVLEHGADLREVASDNEELVNR